MSLTGCRTQEEIAERIGVSQNAIWKLLNGRSKTTKYKTALAFEKVTNGAVSRFRFLEEQGATHMETPNGTEATETPCCPTHVESDRTGSAALTPASALTEAKYQQAADSTDTGVCSSASIPAIGR